MYSNNRNGCRTAPVRGFMALCAIMLAMGLGAMAPPAAAAPFAYVANDSSPGTVSVIDTATKMVVATVPAEVEPAGVAVTPDGKHAYLANQGTLSVPGTTVLVIDMTTNTVVATVGVGNFPSGVAITPDGTHVYVVNGFSNNVSVIDTATTPWWGPRYRWGNSPNRSPSPRMGHTALS